MAESPAELSLDVAAGEDAAGSETLASLHGVTKSFGKTPALRGFDLELRRGEIVALLGPNGAGKTTAISILLGLRAPDSGRAVLFGRDPRDPASRRLVGATPQEIGFPWTLRVRDVVDLVRAHFDEPVSSVELLQRFDLEQSGPRQAGALSGGQKRRLAVALAFAGDPRLLVLDEPTTGLDVEARRGLWEHIREHAGTGASVLLTTHQLDEAEALASRVVVIQHGVVLIEGTAKEIKGKVGLTRIRLRALDIPPLPEISRIERAGEVATIYTASADEVVAELVQRGVRFSDLEILPLTLEEAFLALTRGEVT